MSESCVVATFDISNVDYTFSLMGVYDEKMGVYDEKMGV